MCTMQVNRKTKQSILRLCVFFFRFSSDGCRAAHTDTDDTQLCLFHQLRLHFIDMKNQHAFDAFHVKDRKTIWAQNEKAFGLDWKTNSAMLSLRFHRNRVVCFRFDSCRYKYHFLYYDRFVVMQCRWMLRSFVFHIILPLPLLPSSISCMVHTVRSTKIWSYCFHLVNIHWICSIRQVFVCAFPSCFSSFMRFSLTMAGLAGPFVWLWMTVIAKIYSRNEFNAIHCFHFC